MKLGLLILKNLKIFARSTISLLVIVFSPLLIITLAGIAFNNSLDHTINIGIYSEVYSETSEQFIKDLEEDFKIIRFDRAETCIDSITLRGFHSCIIIPPNLEIGKGETLNFYIDTSRANIASSIQQRIYQSLYDTTQTISEDLTTNLIETILLTERNIILNSERITQETNRVSTSAAQSESSRELLQQSNLEFNIENLNVERLTIVADLVRNRINTAISLSESAISSIEASGSSDEQILSAKSDLESLKQGMENITTNLSQLTTTAQSLSSTISTLEGNLRTARENRHVASEQLTAVLSSLGTTQKELHEIATSFKEILASIQTNPLREAEAIIKPVDIEKTPVVTGSRIQLLFPSLVMLIIMLVSMMMGSSQVIFEKTNRAAKRMAMAPIQFFTQVAGIFTTTFAINLLQIGIILLVTYWIFTVSINILTITILILATIFFIILGMTLGYMFKTENGALLGTLSIASIFFVMSDLILPLESMHPTIMKVVEFFPFVLATDVLKASMFFDANITDLSTKLYVLIGATIFLILTLAIANLFKKKPKKKAK